MSSASKSDSVSSSAAARGVTLFTDRALFAQQWSQVLHGAGLDATAALPSQLPKSIARGAALVIDAASSSYDEDELLTHVGLARAMGAFPVVAFSNESDAASIDDILDDLCGGLVARRAEDVERVAMALARRADDARARRFEYVAVSPRGAEILAIFSDGNAVLLTRPVAPDDDGSAIDSIEIEEDAASASLALESGKRLELSAASVAQQGASRANGQTNGSIDGVKLGRRIRELRLAAGLTQAELARRTGIHRPNIARVEAGRHTPSLETLARLAQAIGVPTTRVLDD
jgi:DNA-binding XRE family transcriptional regulator